MAFAYSLSLPWQRHTAKQATLTHQDNQEIRLRQQRQQAHRRYVAGIGEQFGVGLPELTSAQLFELSRFISSQQHAGLPVKDSDLANLAGIVADLAISTGDDTITLRLKHAGALRHLTVPGEHVAALADVLRRGLVAIPH